MPKDLLSKTVDIYTSISNQVPKSHRHTENREEERNRKSACAALALPIRYTVWVSVRRVLSKQVSGFLGGFFGLLLQKKPHLPISFFLFAYGSYQKTGSTTCNMHNFKRRVPIKKTNKQKHKKGLLYTAMNCTFISSFKILVYQQYKCLLDYHSLPSFQQHNEKHSD